MPCGLLPQLFGQVLVFNRRDVWLVIIITMFLEISVVNANCINPDQTPRSAASDLGQHCLPMSVLWDTRHKLLKM